MSFFKRGDIAYFAGSSWPVLVLGECYIYDGIDGSTPGYRIYMDGWLSGPQEVPRRALITYEENKAYMENRREKAIQDQKRAKQAVHRAFVELFELEDRKNKIPVYEENK